MFRYLLLFYHHCRYTGHAHHHITSYMHNHRNQGGASPLVRKYHKPGLKISYTYHQSALQHVNLSLYHKWYCMYAFCIFVLNCPNSFGYVFEWRLSNICTFLHVGTLSRTNLWFSLNRYSLLHPTILHRFELYIIFLKSTLFPIVNIHSLDKIHFMQCF